MGHLIDWHPAPGDPSILRQFWLVIRHDAPQGLCRLGYTIFVQPLQDLHRWITIPTDATFHVIPQHRNDPTENPHNSPDLMPQ